MADNLYIHNTVQIILFAKILNLNLYLKHKNKNKLTYTTKNTSVLIKVTTF